jgi:hypothetical protein
MAFWDIIAVYSVIRNMSMLSVGKKFVLMHYVMKAYGGVDV